MAEKLNKIVVDVGGKEYELSGGGGGTVGPNTVDSDAIIDRSVGKVDLDDDVNEGLDELNNISLTDKDLEDIFDNDSNQASNEE